MRPQWILFAFVALFPGCTRGASAASTAALSEGYDPHVGSMVSVTSPGRGFAEVRLERMWRFELPASLSSYAGPASGAPVGRWIEVPLAGSSRPSTTRIEINGRGVSLATLAGTPLPIGTYAVRATIDGVTARSTFHNGPIHCNDVMIGRAPSGLHPACIATERGAIAMFVPAVPW